MTSCDGIIKVDQDIPFAVVSCEGADVDPERNRNYATHFREIHCIHTYTSTMENETAVG